MEFLEGKIEIDKLDLDFCLIHVFYMIMPYGPIDWNYNFA
jgi:hypothetical protein